MGTIREQSKRAHLQPTVVLVVLMVLLVVRRSSIVIRLGVLWRWMWECERCHFNPPAPRGGHHSEQRAAGPHVRSGPV